ncbi:MAG: thioredoxin fold domain-containing protein [Spirochaetales bacterium]|nr:thioredoxin fold domain-containing protein [Spirochaetales bacterium]
MKKVRLSPVLFVLCWQSAFAQDWLGSLAEARDAARQSGKPVYLDIYAEWCGFCRKLFHEEYPRSEFQEAIQHFVRVRLDGEKHPRIMQEFGIRGFPTIVIFNSQGQEIERIQGYKPAAQIARILRDITRRSQGPADPVPEGGPPPVGLQAHYKLATQYFENNQWSKAREHFLQAYFSEDATLSPGLQQVSLYNAAVAAMKNQDFVLAISYWHVYTAAYPESKDLAEARYFRARAYRFLGMQSEARPDLVYAAKHLKSAKDREQALRELKAL